MNKIKKEEESLVKQVNHFTNPNTLSAIQSLPK